MTKRCSDAWTTVNHSARTNAAARHWSGDPTRRIRSTGGLRVTRVSTLQVSLAVLCWPQTFSSKCNPQKHCLTWPSRTISHALLTCFPQLKLHVLNNQRGKFQRTASQIASIRSTDANCSLPWNWLLSVSFRISNESGAVDNYDFKRETVPAHWNMSQHTTPTIVARFTSESTTSNSSDCSTMIRRAQNY